MVSDTGLSDLSTVIGTDLEKTAWPAEVFPTAVSDERPGRIMAGMVRENVAGADVLASSGPPGTRMPIEVNVKLAGEVIVTEMVCPEFTVVPSAGEVICSAGWLCCPKQGGARVRSRAVMHRNRETHFVAE